MKNGTNVPSDKSSIISCVPYRACVMVIIRATVAKVMQNNLERMLAAWVMGEGESRARMSMATPLLSPFLFRDRKRIAVTLPPRLLRFEPMLSK